MWIMLHMWIHIDNEYDMTQCHDTLTHTYTWQYDMTWWHTYDWLTWHNDIWSWWGVDGRGERGRGGCEEKAEMFWWRSILKWYHNES